MMNDTNSTIIDFSRPRLYLSQLLEAYCVVPKAQDKLALGFTAISQGVKPGYVFAAIARGKEFIDQAVDFGACAIISDEPLTQEIAVPVFVVPDLAEQVGRLAGRFYNDPSRQMGMIGITGTNGKTTCSQLIASAFALAELKCGIIGTLGYGLPGELIPLRHTTPDAATIQSILSSLLADESKVVAMEVSSHALVQHRVTGVHFDTAVLTNLSRDHLDYHKTMADYAAAKRQLFVSPGLSQAVINADDAFGQELIQEFHSSLTIYAYSQQGHELENTNSVLATNIVLNGDGITADIVSPWGDGVLRSPLLGRFNLSNLLAVISCLCLYGVDLTDVLDIIPDLPRVDGRMQPLGGGEQPLVVVDYAHTPDALANALQALREHCHGNLICVFGCGGDRDKGKRPQMAAIAEQYADRVWVTNDNPRTEDAAAIVTDINAGFKQPEQVQVEYDRAMAISHAIKSAASGDVVLVAGKGHEDYQIIGETRHDFSDVAQVEQCLI